MTTTGLVHLNLHACDPCPARLRDLVPPTEVLCGVGRVAGAALPAVGRATAGVLVPLPAGAVFSRAAFGWVRPAALAEEARRG